AASPGADSCGRPGGGRAGGAGPDGASAGRGGGSRGGGGRPEPGGVGGAGGRRASDRRAGGGPGRRGVMRAGAPHAGAAPVWQTARGPVTLEQPRIVGILNVTPDSFWDGGRHADTDAAVAHAAA